MGRYHKRFFTLAPFVVALILAVSSNFYWIFAGMFLLLFGLLCLVVYMAAYFAKTQRRMPVFREVISVSVIWSLIYSAIIMIMLVIIGLYEVKIEILSVTLVLIAIGVPVVATVFLIFVAIFLTFYGKSNRGDGNNGGDRTNRVGFGDSP